MIVITTALICALYRSKSDLTKRALVVTLILIVGWWCYTPVQAVANTPSVVVTTVTPHRTNEVSQQVLAAEVSLPLPILPLNSANITYLTNLYRIELGVNPLTTSNVLAKSSSAHLQDLLSLHYWSHSRIGHPWTEWFVAVGINSGPVGENLARCYASSNQVLAAWEASPDHQLNLANPLFHHLGVAVGYDSVIGCSIVVQQFSAE